MMAFSISPNAMLASCVVIAFILDYVLGEPKKYHPLVGFGWWASLIEARLNKAQGTPEGKVNDNNYQECASGISKRIVGFVAYLLVVLPILLAIILIDSVLKQSQYLYFIIAPFGLYLSLGWKSLLLHAKAIYLPLLNGNIDIARHALSMIVSRDTANLEEKDIAKAATESILENGADAIFSAIFCVRPATRPPLFYPLSPYTSALGVNNPSHKVKLETFYLFHT